MSTVRRDLLILTSILVAFGIAVTSYMFFQSMRPSARAKSEYMVVIDPDHIRPGEIKDFTNTYINAYIFKPNDEQWQDIKFLDEHVWDNRLTAYSPKLKVFVYVPVGHLGCQLNEIPKGDKSLDDDGRIWLGGYFDPCHGTMYDYAGRTLKTYKYHGFKYPQTRPNLTAPDYEVIKGKIILRR